MNSNNNTTQKSGFMTSLQAAFERFIMRRAHRPDQPYVPQPGQNSVSTFEPHNPRIKYIIIKN